MCAVPSLLGRTVSESRRLCHGDGGHGGGDSASRPVAGARSVPLGKRNASVVRRSRVAAGNTLRPLVRVHGGGERAASVQHQPEPEEVPLPRRIGVVLERCPVMEHRAVIEEDRLAIMTFLSEWTIGRRSSGQRRLNSEPAPAGASRAVAGLREPTSHPQGRTAGASKVIPRARHMRNSSRSTSSGAPYSYGSARIPTRQLRSRRWSEPRPCHSRR